MTDDQLPLFDQAHARWSDPDTSHDAAASVTVLLQRSYVLAAARDLMVFIDPELQIRVRSMYPDRPFSDSGVRTRRSELVRLTLIADTGERVTLPSGRRAILWAIVPEDQRGGDTQPGGTSYRSGDGPDTTTRGGGRAE